MQRNIYSLFLSFLLCQCTTYQTPLQLSPSLNTLSNHHITAWTLTGIIGTKTTKKAWSAHLSWIQNGPQQYHIQLTSPFGQDHIQIQRAYQTVTYKDERQVIRSQDASHLLQQQTGISLPIDSLYYWIRGIPAPRAIQTKIDYPTKQLKILKQFGYTISYSEYQKIDLYWLPTKLKLTGPGLLVKVVIKSWKISFPGK